jgi:RNA:NAD 2'-phosphotransferase (TPT1/KptA family)
MAIRTYHKAHSGRLLKANNANAIVDDRLHLIHGRLVKTVLRHEAVVSGCRSKLEGWKTLPQKIACWKIKGRCGHGCTSRAQHGHSCRRGIRLQASSSVLGCNRQRETSVSKNTEQTRSQLESSRQGCWPPLMCLSIFGPHAVVANLVPIAFGRVGCNSPVVLEETLLQSNLL